MSPGGHRLGPALTVVHGVLALDVGGLERNVLNQIREGHRLGQRVAVVCLERPGTLAPQAEALGARVVTLGKRPGLRPEVVGRMRAALRELAPDVVHTHDVATLLYTGPAARRAGAPVVVHTEHGRGDYGRFRTRTLGRLAGRYARRFYCLTEDMADWVTAHGVAPRARVRVIHNGIDTACFRDPGDPGEVRRSLGIPSGAPVVGTVGRLNEVKRQDVLLRAFARVRQSLPDAHLVLVGDGPLRGNLGTLAEGLGLSGCVHFAGYQPRSTPYLAVMDAFALTSRSEGMPQAALEAQVAGVPVVATRVGGLPELLDEGRTGLLVKPGDEGAVADALLRVLTDRELAGRLSAAGRELVEGRFDVGRMAEVYHRDFLELLGRVN